MLVEQRRLTGRARNKSKEGRLSFNWRKGEKHETCITCFEKVLLFPSSNNHGGGGGGMT